MKIKWNLKNLKNPNAGRERGQIDQRRFGTRRTGKMVDFSPKILLNESSSNLITSKHEL